MVGHGDMAALERILQPKAAAKWQSPASIPSSWQVFLIFRKIIWNKTRAAVSHFRRSAHTQAS